MNSFQAWLNTALAAFGPAIILWQLARTRIDAIHAASKAEDAAKEAATHAVRATEALGVMGDNVLKIELATNSMKDALIAATATASHLEGRAEAIAERKIEDAASDPTLKGS